MFLLDHWWVIAMRCMVEAIQSIKGDAKHTWFPARAHLGTAGSHLPR